MIETELQTISHLTGIDKTAIRFSDEGFLSRGYIIDNGRIVFKFKKWPEISYQNEIQTLNLINSLNLGVNLQKVNWISKDDSYLGLYGVVGQPLNSLNLDATACKNYGQQIGTFLQKLHSANPPKADKLPLVAEISEWQKRFHDSKDVLLRYFSDAEITKMATFVHSVVPRQLTALGEKLVFSHGDLWMGNILIDQKGQIGVIDFSDSGYLDEAADFMDLEDTKLCAEVLSTYQADAKLKAKVKIRQIIRPMFVIGTYRDQPTEKIQPFVAAIRQWLRQTDVSS